VHLLVVAFLPVVAAVHAHLSLTAVHAVKSLAASVQVVIYLQVLLKAVVFVVVDAVKTQIPSHPPELHEVLVKYV
jgi:hypothetical protein